VADGAGGLKRRWRGPGTTCRTITPGRARRWDEDGLAGFCDIEQRLCPGLALRNNGRDPILQEHAFGPTGAQGNPGEHVNDH
jgi:hypothetical protein